MGHFLRRRRRPGRTWPDRVTLSSQQVNVARVVSDCFVERGVQQFQQRQLAKFECPLHALEERIPVVQSKVNEAREKTGKDALSFELVEGLHALLRSRTVSQPHRENATVR